MYNKSEDRLLELMELGARLEAVNGERLEYVLKCLRLMVEAQEVIAQHGDRCSCPRADTCDE